MAEYSFDTWGRRRNPTDWSYTLTGQPELFADRGFTGHEYLEDFKLYNMNGRLYDPVVGRFLSPDPYIQDPGFTQNLNRYSYCMNNPLKFNDPSGEFWNLLFVWGGNYVINWLDNTINKKMSPQQAFKQPIMLSGNYSPSDNRLFNSQVDAQLGARSLELSMLKQDKLLTQKIAQAASAERQRNLKNNYNMTLPYPEMDPEINYDITVPGTSGYIKDASIDLGDKSVSADIYYAPSKNNVVRTVYLPRHQPAAVPMTQIRGYLVYYMNSNYNVVTLRFSDQSNYNIFKNYIFGH